MSRRPVHQWPGAGAQPGPPDRQLTSNHGPRHPSSSGRDGYRDSNTVYMPHSPEPPSRFGGNHHGNGRHPGPFRGPMHSGSRHPSPDSPVFSPRSGFSTTIDYGGGNSVSLHSNIHDPRDSYGSGSPHSPHEWSPRDRSPERSPTRFGGRAGGSSYRSSGFNFDDYLDHNGERRGRFGSGGRRGPRTRSPGTRYGLTDGYSRYDDADDDTDDGVRRGGFGSGGRSGPRTRSPGTRLGLSWAYGRYDVDDDDSFSDDDDDDDDGSDYDDDNYGRGERYSGTRHSNGGRNGGHTAAAAATAYPGSRPAQSLGSGSHTRPGDREGRHGMDCFAAHGAFGSSRDFGRRHRSGRY